MLIIFSEIFPEWLPKKCSLGVFYCRVAKKHQSAPMGSSRNSRWNGGGVWKNWIFARKINISETKEDKDS